ncbi:MAG: hypothetical protein H6712_33625 [Myxococcales bacterium]|nr:hypothetical protein [Myxococcales bacterium]
MTVIDPDALDQVVRTLQRSRELLEQLVIRGVRTAGPAELDRLDALREELGRHGTTHLAGRLHALLVAMRNDDPAAAVALLRAQATLHVLERVLTMRVVEAELAGAGGGAP